MVNTAKKNWLIRTRNNQILGPISLEKVKELIANKLAHPQDELCCGNGYWFFIKETNLIDKYVFGNDVQPFNPIGEAKDVLTKDCAWPSSSLVGLGGGEDVSVGSGSSSSSKPSVILPSNEDLEYPQDHQKNQDSDGPGVAIPNLVDKIDNQGNQYNEEEADDSGQRAYDDITRALKLDQVNELKESSVSSELSAKPKPVAVAPTPEEMRPAVEKMALELELEEGPRIESVRKEKAENINANINAQPRIQKKGSDRYLFAILLAVIIALIGALHFGKRVMMSVIDLTK